MIVIGSGEAVMLIVPANEQLLVDLRVSPADADDIGLGQAALVRLTGFSVPVASELRGVVESISPATAVDPATGVMFYDVRVAVPEAERRRLGEAARIMPGMPAEAFLQTEMRTVLAYLAQPLVEQVMHAFREK